jgi:hypothetical protein
VLQRIWTEMDYRLDVCPDTKGGHVEHLWGMHKKKTWRVSPPIWRWYITILSAIYVYRFSETCQGIINNPIIPPYVVCLLKYSIDGIL